jgi:two-component system NtrC family sensor kinase
MTCSAATINGRILLIDDLRSIHEDFARILVRPTGGEALDALDSELFGGPAASTDAGFELDSAYQGQDGLTKLDVSLQEQRPYAVAFVDMRMPPGWDGLETIEHLWASDPHLQVVVCTAYSDYPWSKFIERLHAGDNLLILKKPFEPVEVMQLARALAAKWSVERLVDDMIARCAPQSAAGASR